MTACRRPRPTAANTPSVTAGSAAPGALCLLRSRPILASPGTCRWPSDLSPGDGRSASRNPTSCTVVPAAGARVCRLGPPPDSTHGDVSSRRSDPPPPGPQHPEGTRIRGVYGSCPAVPCPRPERGTPPPPDHEALPHVVTVPGPRPLLPAAYRQHRPVLDPAGGGLTGSPRRGRRRGRDRWPVAGGGRAGARGRAVRVRGHGPGRPQPGREPR